MLELVQSCDSVLKNNLHLSEQEKILIIKDDTKEKIANAFAIAAKEIANNLEIIKIPVLETNGMEPPQYAANAMLNSDVVIVVTDKSLSWTNARLNATNKGVRIATMTRITEDILIRTAKADYSKIRERVNKIADKLDKAEKVKIISENGTDLSFSIKGRIAHGRKGGIYEKPGYWGNIPCGEAFIAPVEGTTEGVYVVDGSQSGVGIIKEPMPIYVKHGFANKITGGHEAEKLNKTLKSINDPNAFNIAEFGIGANDSADLSGITLEDEKVFGTCHIALGRNDLFGGKVNVNIHVDGVIKEADIYLDGVKLEID